jgi:hypothetical protein
MAGYLEGSQGPGRTGGAQVDCRANARLPGQAVLACMQCNGRVYHFQVVEREDVLRESRQRLKLVAPEKVTARPGN